MSEEELGILLEKQAREGVQAVATLCSDPEFNLRRGLRLLGNAVEGYQLLLQELGEEKTRVAAPTEQLTGLFREMIEAFKTNIQLPPLDISTLTPMSLDAVDEHEEGEE